jgi:hypothetical protein
MNGRGRTLAGFFAEVGYALHGHGATTNQAVEGLNPPV